MKQENTPQNPLSAGTVDLESNAEEMAKLGLEQAHDALAKLPILGPALWLYARDPIRKFTFIADIDWLLLPPVILDQCRLYTKKDIPFAFFTWARVNETVDARFHAGIGKIAPHEWHSGSHVWLIDFVAPFGQLDEMLTELRETVLAGERVNALIPDPHLGGMLVVKEWDAMPVKSSVQ